MSYANQGDETKDGVGAQDVISACELSDAGGRRRDGATYITITTLGEARRSGCVI